MLEILGLNEEIEKSINSRKRITGFRRTRMGEEHTGEKIRIVCCFK